MTPQITDRRRAIADRNVQAILDANATAALTAAEPRTGPALDALARLVAVGWRELGRHAGMAEAAAARLSPDAMARSHQAARLPIAELVTRGRRDGSFRTDVPESWLVTCCLALFHSCADEVRAGRLDPASAERVLTTTITDLFTENR